MNWSHVRGPVVRLGPQAVAANTSVQLMAMTALDSTEDCTIRDLTLHTSLVRGYATALKILIVVAPDDIIAGMTGADLWDEDILNEYEDFIWLEHTAFFGTPATTGDENYNIDLKTGTMRSLGAYDKCVVFIQVKDVFNQAANADCAYCFDYFYRTKGLAA